MKKIAFLGTAIACVVLCSCLSVSTEAKASEGAQAKQDNRIIPQGIVIGDIDVSGMTVSEADQAIAESMSQFDNLEFVISANDKTVKATGKELCICAKNKKITKTAAQYGQIGNIAERFKAQDDLKNGRKKTFQLSICADKKGLKNYIHTVAKQINDPASDNTLIRENGKFVFKKGNSGVVVEETQAVNQISEYFSNNWDKKGTTFELATELREPRGSQEELSEIKDLLGAYSTDFSSSASARANNVSNGAKLINGTILFPGDEFSVLETITPFSEENGYQLAGSYENGTTVETFGGGICQVSSTLYGAVRQAELGVVTRSCHSMLVNYVEPSQDAAISESGSKDFQIRNNKNYPVYIEGYTQDGIIYFNIFGKEEDPPGHSVEYETEITEVNIQNTAWVADESLPLGHMSTSSSGHTGYKAKLWKIVYEDGEEVDRFVYNNSTYNPSNRTVRVGVGSPDASVKGAMINAVASQNPNAIASTIATLAPGAYNPSVFTIKPKYQVTVKDEEGQESAAEPAQSQAIVPAVAPAEVPAEAVPAETSVGEAPVAETPVAPAGEPAVTAPASPEPVTAN